MLPLKCTFTSLKTDKELLDLGALDVQRDPNNMSGIVLVPADKYEFLKSQLFNLAQFPKSKGPLVRFSFESTASDTDLLALGATRVVRAPGQKAGFVELPLLDHAKIRAVCSQLNPLQKISLQEALKADQPEEEDLVASLAAEAPPPRKSGNLFDWVPRLCENCGLADAYYYNRKQPKNGFKCSVCSSNV